MKVNDRVQINTAYKNGKSTESVKGTVLHVNREKVTVKLDTGEVITVLKMFVEVLEIAKPFIDQFIDWIRKIFRKNSKNAL